MPVNKHALIRYRVIDKCLRNRYKPYPSLEDLKESCEEVLYGSIGERVSISTIEKDLFDMRNNKVLGFYAPIKYSHQERGYFYSEDSYSIDKKPLSDQEIKAIQFASETLFHFREAGLFTVFAGAIEKIFEQLHIVSAVEDPNMQEVVQFESIPKAKGMEWIRPLYDAVRQKSELSIQHRKFGDETMSVMIFHPYVLKEYRNRWYVIGYSTSRRRIISLGMDRIQSVELTGDYFERVEEFNPVTYFRDSYGITEGGLVPERTVLAFNPSQGPYLLSQPLHDSQKVLEDSELVFRIELFVKPNYEFKQMILGYGPDVKVEEPSRLRDEIRELHKSASEL